MARSYVIEECQADLNESVKICRTPGQCLGAQVHFPDLLEEKVMKHVSDKIQLNLLLKGTIKYLFVPTSNTVWILFLCVSMKSNAKSQQMVRNYR